MTAMTLLVLGLLFAVPRILELWWFFVVIDCYRLLKLEEVERKLQYSMVSGVKKFEYAVRLAGHFRKRQKAKEMEMVLEEKFGVDVDTSESKLLSVGN